jgi:hypothetical protein
MIARRAAGVNARRLVKFREVAADERVVNWLARYAAVFVAELARVAAEGVILA